MGFFDYVYQGLGVKPVEKKADTAPNGADPWAALYGWATLPVKEAVKDAPTPGSSPIYDQLKDTGLSASSKPSASTLDKVRGVLVKVVSPEDACLLLAWLGGAHDAADAAFASTSVALSAQAACGQDLSSVDQAKKAAAAAGAAQGSILGPTGIAAGAALGWLGATLAGQKAYRGINTVLDDMAARGSDLAKCAELLRGAGKGVAKASAKKQNKEADADALKLAKDALGAVTPDGLGQPIGIGLGVAAAAVAVVVAYKILK